MGENTGVSKGALLSQGHREFETHVSLEAPTPPPERHILHPWFCFVVSLDKVFPLPTTQEHEPWRGEEDVTLVALDHVRGRAWYLDSDDRTV